MPEWFPRAYSAAPIEPVVEVGQKILTFDREAYRLYDIAFIEPIAPSGTLIINGGALAAGAQTAVINTQAVLDNQYGQLSQIRLRVLDDIQVTLLQPQALTRFTLRNVNANINVFSRLADPTDHLTETYIMEDDRLFMRMMNPRTVAIAQSRALCYGFKYVLAGTEGPVTSGGKASPLAVYMSIRDAKKDGHVFTVVPVGGWGR